MTSALPDPSTDFGARVARRLAEDPIAWLTVVDGVGTPLRFTPRRARGH